MRLSDDLYRYFEEEVFRTADEGMRDALLLAAIPRIEVARGH